MVFTLQRPEAEVPIVGEAGYRDTLDRYGGGRDEDGAVFADHAAVLIAEPENRYDQHAVAVFICDELGTAEQVGYLSHDDAVAYAPILRLVRPAVPMCLLTIRGGWDRGPGDRRYHSAVLNMGSAAEMAAEWWLQHHQPRRVPELADSSVVFIGRSRFAIGGVRLDAAAQAMLADHAGCVVAPDDGTAAGLAVVGVIPGPEALPDDRPGVRGDAAERLRTARNAGVPLMDEERFWDRLGVDLERWGGREPGQAG